jgi:hypothetical protein
MSNPVESLIRKFGTQEALGRAAGVRQSSVADWKRRGYIPAPRQRDILKNAPAFGVVVTPNDFFAPTTEAAQ